MKYALIALICSLFLPIEGVMSCGHNIDPSSLKTFGYSTFTGDGHVRVEYLTGKSLPGKKALKIYFVDNLEKSKLEYLDLSKNPSIKEKLDTIRDYALRIPYWGTRGGWAGDKVVVAGKELEFKAYLSQDNLDMDDIMADMEKRFAFQFDPAHHMKEKLELGYRPRVLKEEGLDIWKGLDILVVSVKEVSQDPESQGLALKITGPKFEDYNEFLYFVEMTRLKMLELNMSSTGDWAFKIEDAQTPYEFLDDKGRSREVSGAFLKMLKYFPNNDESWYFLRERGEPKTLGIFYEDFYQLRLPYKRLAISSDEALLINAFHYSLEHGPSWTSLYEDEADLIFYRPRKDID